MLTRRSLLAAGALATLPLGQLRAQDFAKGENPDIIPLWPGEPYGGGGPSGSPILRITGALSGIATPYIEVVRPEKPNGAGVLVVPGGGYQLVSMGGEGQPAARWLAARGYTVFLLAYRLPDEQWKTGRICAFQDAQRAMRLIRSRARQFKIDPANLGAFGFSAGGHLVGMTSTFSQYEAYVPADGVDGFSARPDWSVLAYPVITVFPPYDHTGTRKRLLPEQPTVEELMFWSVETHVSAASPPTFLVHASDDPIAHVHHSELMKAALDKAGISAEFLQLPAGGHGFGMGIQGRPSFGWTAKLDDWLDRLQKTRQPTAEIAAAPARKL